MIPFFRISSLAIAIAATGGAGQAQGAVTINEGLDGTWFNPAQAGRGVSVDVIPQDDGSAVFFGGVFSYDAQGNPVWLTLSTTFAPGQSTKTGVAVIRNSGGTFGNAFTAPASAQVGTARVSVDTCRTMQLALDMTDASGLSDVTLDVTPSQAGVGFSPNAQCSENDALNACPAGTTMVGEDCQLPTAITNSLFLPFGKKYIVRGQVSVESGGTLTIAPGVVVQGSTDRSSPNFIAVKIGGRIYAEGTASQPITFTGPQDVPGSWAGIVIAGRSNCNDATSAQICQFEAVPSITYGSATPDINDNSGSLRYVRIRWAGQQIAPNEELNSLTLMGVGAGTRMEYVQVDGGLDDGFEMFGGTINGRYLVCSNMGDDCFDFDQGYQGKIQFALSWQGTNADIGGDSNGVESDNDNPASDKLPRTRPTVANLTLVGTGTAGNEGIRIRRGSAGTYMGVVVTGYRDRCINMIDPQTYAVGGSATAQGTDLNIGSSFVGQCTGGAFEDTATAAYAVSAWYGVGQGNESGNPLVVANGFMPQAGSPVLSGGRAPADAWFRPVAYRGAFASATDTWTRGWTVRLPVN